MCVSTIISDENLMNNLDFLQNIFVRCFGRDGVQSGLDFIFGSEKKYFHMRETDVNGAPTSVK